MFACRSLAGLTLLVFVACSGKTTEQGVRPTATGGTSAGALGGDGGEATEGGFSAGGALHGAGTGASSAGGLAGSGGIGATAGAGVAVRGGAGGASARGGANAGGGASAHGGVGTGGSTSPAPAAWTCPANLYGDGKSCDCGCGTTDPDCGDASVGSCDKCAVLGGCAHGPCPSNVVPDDNAHCSVPSDWLCEPGRYGDGVCDCGCGVVDADCPSSRADACTSCPITGCARYLDCATIDQADNTICTAPPTSWTCDARTYRDGARCDCGCGFWDPDCSSKDVASCQTCDDYGSCSEQPCAGTIDPQRNGSCIQPAPPSGWTCDAASYADGHFCNCGCGVQDPDCRENTPDLCDRCGCGVRCPASVDAADPTQCAPAPAGWTCAPDSYANGHCDCGCGVLDADCLLAGNVNDCETCGGCARGHCALVDVSDSAQCVVLPPEWTCAPEIYGDDTCDCGCGLVDLDCMDSLKSRCERCDSQGSCSSVACSDAQSTIKAASNAFCSN